MLSGTFSQIVASTLRRLRLFYSSMWEQCGNASIQPSRPPEMLRWVTTQKRKYLFITA